MMVFVKKDIILYPSCAPFFDVRSGKAERVASVSFVAERH